MDQTGVIPESPHRHVPAATPHPARACYRDDARPVAIAHRGGAGLAPENTMTAFARSYALGFRYLETDVRLTADGVCVLFHDAGTRRLTGVPGRLDRFTWAQLRRLSVFGVEPVARLEDLLQAFPDARLALDLKDPRAIGRIAALVRGFAAHERICLAGSADQWLADARAVIGSGVATAMGWQSTVRLVAAARLGHRPRGVIAAPYVHIPLRLHGVPVFWDRLVAMAADRGSAVVVWTVDEPTTMARLLDAGVHAVITDRPDLLREVLVARDAWRPGQPACGDVSRPAATSARLRQAGPR
jgi:glycerophosphoryl diester phosphodiesterase